MSEQEEAFEKWWTDFTNQFGTDNDPKKVARLAFTMGGIAATDRILAGMNVGSKGN